MTPPPGHLRWGEDAAQLRYLSMSLVGYVAALSDQNLPPRGHVPWGPGDVAALGQLTRALAEGERDAERAAGALDDIARVFERSAADSQETHDGDGDGDGGPGGRHTPAATLLARYLGQRAIALDSLPRLQRLTELRRPAPAPARPGPWQAIRAWMRTKIRRHAPG